MIRATQRMSLWVGATALMAIIAGGSEARAGAVIIKTGGVQGVGDPFFDYQFEIYLTPGTILKVGDSIQVQDLIGIAPGAGTSQPGGSVLSPPQYGPFVSSITQVGTNPTASDVTWINSSSSPIVDHSASDLFLGYFTVFGNLDTPSGTNPTTDVTYVGTSHSTSDPNGPPTTNTGFLTLTSGIIFNPIQPSSIPEPSSMILMLAGGCIPPYLAFRQGRRAARAS